MGLTKLEEMIVEATLLRKSLDDCCPDVGMGPTINMLLNEVIDRTSITDADFDRGRVIVELTKHLRGARRR